jgi:hypothetical protein
VLTVHSLSVKGVLVRVILVSLVVLVLGAPLLAQSPTGSIGGIVFDADARTIPGAEIIVVNDLTRVQYETKTNDSGIYAVPNLPPGPYRVQASKVGFKTLIKPDIILNVQEAITVNFTLPVGASSIAVTVEGGAPIIDTTDATVSTVVDRQFAENLPMNGRSFQTLIYLTPGVVATPSTPSDSGQFSVNGQRAASNYWMVDGVSANIGIGAAHTPGNGIGGTLGSLTAMGGTNGLVSVDAMEEFRIQTSTFAPEFGRTPGAQISIVTRSGTNDWHGTAFDYLRNDVFDAANWFNGYTNNPPLPKAEERQNDFGGTVGGPIVRDRTFFFFSYEGMRLRLPQTAITNVPDLAARESATPAMQPYLDAFPRPNGSDDAAAGIAAFNASYSNPSSLDAYSLRVDHKLTSKWSLFGRYNYSPSNLTTRGASGVSLSVVQPFQITTQTMTAGATWTISPILVNDLRANYSHTNAESYQYLDNFGGAVPLAALPWPDGFNSKNSLFEIQILSVGPGGAISAGRNTKNEQKQFNVVDSLTWQKGSHALKMGVDFRQLDPVSSPYTYLQDAAFSDVADSESGNIDYGFIESRKVVPLRFRNLGLYAQDSWRALPRLSITYGLRWDIDFAPASLNGPGIPALTGYNLSDLSNLAIAPAGTPAFHTPYGSFAPRVGLAYQLGDHPGRQTVLRGGVGVFYDLVSAEAGNAIDSLVPPFGTYTFLSQTTFPYTSAEGAPPAISPVASLSNFEAFNPNLKLPYTLEWNFSIEQALGNQQSLSASYIGASGRRLLQTSVYISPPTNPAISEADFVDNTASSAYNALQIQFQRRLSRGLQALASYTWSHSIDDGSASSAGSLSNAGIPGSPNQNRGSSDFDIRNSFSAGVTYNIPTPNGNGLVKAILGNWSTENFVLARSAPPVDIEDVNFFEFDNGVYTNIRPDVVPGQAFYLYGSQYPGGKAINPAAFKDPPVDPATGNPARQGNLGRNALRGFGATEWDFALHRDFPIRESWKLQFRAEVFNLLNHPNFGPPNNAFDSQGFGISTQMLGQSLSGGTLSGGLNPLYQIGGPRSVQFALKLFF